MTYLRPVVAFLVVVSGLAMFIPMHEALHCAHYLVFESGSVCEVHYHTHAHEGTLIGFAGTSTGSLSWDHWLIYPTQAVHLSLIGLAAYLIVRPS